MAPRASDVPDGEWHAYGRTAAGQRWSPLAQITPANVGDLQVAWQFRTGDMRGRPGDPEETTDEVTPLKIGSRLYFCTPHQSVIALDATTGAQAWRYDPKIATGLALQHQTCRGVSYQPAPDRRGDRGRRAGRRRRQRRHVRPPLDIAANDGKARADCGAKLFLATADGRLIALDPDTGAVCSRFGGGTGQIDLGADMPNLNPGSYYSTSPVVVTSEAGHRGRHGAGQRVDQGGVGRHPGLRHRHRRAGVELGLRQPGRHHADRAAGQSYTANSPNSWSIASVDEALGMVYLPMGNQPPDQWGGQRSPAVEKYSSSVVALDLATGQVRWVFQTVHHDLWDYDVPSQPSLVDLTVNGATVPALVQPTKQGELFVLDRRTGKPVLPVTEVPAPQGAAAGDHAAPTQPKSALSYEPPRADRQGHVGRDHRRPDGVPHRVRQAALRGPLHAAVDAGLADLSRATSARSTGAAWRSIRSARSRSRRRPTWPSSPRWCRARTRRVRLVQGNDPPHGMLPALNENFGAPFAIKLGPFTSPLGIPCQAPPWGYVAGADLAHRPDRLEASQRHRARPVAGAAADPHGRARPRRPGDDGRRRRVPVRAAWTTTCAATTCTTAASCGRAGCRRAARPRR